MTRSDPSPDEAQTGEALTGKDEGVARRTVTARSRSTAPIEAVWNRLADGATWKDWAWFPSSSLAREGVPAPDGIGAIRRFGVGPIGSREEVVAFEPPTHLTYVLRSGLPVRDYRSEVTLTPTEDGGTDIEWVSSFRSPSWAAGFWTAFLRRQITGFATGLARAATR